MRFKVNDWYNLHDGFYLNLRPGYTALVGPNGAGKSTLLHQISEYAKSKDIPVIQYSNIKNGGNHARQEYLESGSTEEFVNAFISSEGQELRLHFSNFVPKIGEAVSKAEAENKKLIVLLDGLDSGLSIDATREMMDFFDFVEKEIGLTPNRKANPEVYIIVAVNSYELASRYCIDVRTGKSITFKDYNDYAKFICEYKDTHKKTEVNAERNNL